jgi:uncharacterized membrane protein YkvI
MNESANRLFRILAWLFLLAIVAQVFLAGLASLAGESWDLHRALGHLLAFILIPMLIVMHLGRAGRQVLLLTWLLFLVWIVQVYVLVIFLRQTMPPVAALHPVLALVEFWLVVRLLAAAKPAPSA